MERLDLYLAGGRVITESLVGDLRRVGETYARRYLDEVEVAVAGVDFAAYVMLEGIHDLKEYPSDRAAYLRQMAEEFMLNLSRTLHPQRGSGGSPK